MHACARFFLAALFVAAVTSAQAAGRGPVEVGVGQATVLHLDRPVRHVIVGNPAVADVTVQDPRLIVVFGRQAGGTSLSLLDAKGTPVFEAPVVVGGGGDGVVAVTWAAGKDIKPGGDGTSFVCAGATCAKAAAAGDKNAATPGK